MSSPVREYRTIVKDSGDPGYVNRLLVGTPVTGLVRVEWVQARYGQIVPVNWSMVTMNSYLDSYMPLRYQVDDAQNLIVKEVIERDFEWLLLIEHDVLLPPDAFMKLNSYIDEAKYPVVSGLYFTRNNPSEPLIFRGRGNSYYSNWKLGDKVMVDGVPTGMLLIHAGLLREMWKDSPEYAVRGTVTRRIFYTPRDLWYDPQFGQVNTTSGTSDLDWCTRVVRDKYLERAGWTEFKDDPYPFLVDTNLFCYHINNDGEQFPKVEDVAKFVREE